MSTNEAAGTRHNLEIKARVDAATLADARDRLSAGGVTPLVRLGQVDTYFDVRRGRLKLREIVSDGGMTRAELIAYARPDADGPRWSAYRQVSLDVDAAAAIKAVLVETVGLLVVVRKRRAVGVHGRTRIHLDEVQGLGTFIELETVVAGAPADDAGDELRAVARLIGLDLARVEMVAGSYSDLLLANAAGEAATATMEGVTG